MNYESTLLIKLIICFIHYFLIFLIIKNGGKYMLTKEFSEIKRITMKEKSI